MPLPGEKDDKLFQELNKHCHIQVIGHTHLCNAMQGFYRKAGSDTNMQRKRRFALCKVLLFPTTQQTVEVGAALNRILI